MIGTWFKAGGQASQMHCPNAQQLRNAWLQNGLQSTFSEHLTGALASTDVDFPVIFLNNKRINHRINNRI